MRHQDDVCKPLAARHITLWIAFASFGKVPAFCHLMSLVLNLTAPISGSVKSMGR
jgi:hypothetical protein